MQSMPLSEEDIIINDKISSNYITNELIQKYDQKFNDLYRRIVNINSSIMNKEELIYKENDEIQNKNNTIQILQYTMVLVVLFGVLLIMYSYKKITLTKLFFYSILLFIIYLIVIYINIYSSLSISNTGTYLNNLQVDLVQFYEKNIEDTSGYQCPATCPSITPPPPPNPNQIQTYQQPTLNIDPQTNVWQYGDIPTDLYTSSTTPGTTFYANPPNIPNYSPSEENEPKSFFGTTYPSTTYYQCEWLGGSNTVGLPNIETNTYTTIPCTFRQNFQEVGRYICKQDPNQNGIENCDNVSN